MERKRFNLTISEFAQKLAGEKSVALFLHIRPDGDAIGSGFALKRALVEKGIDCDVYCDDYIPRKFSFLATDLTVKNQIDKEYSAFCAVDCADVTRVGKFGDAFLNHPRTYNLDHHVSNNRYALFNTVIESGANAENVYDVITAMGVNADKNVSDLLATGVITDTGNLKHKNVTERTVSILAKLVGNGADLHTIIYNTFTAQSKERAKLFGKVMNRLRFFYDDKIVIATVFLKDLEETGATADETEGFVDFTMSIRGTEVGVCLMETDKNVFKASLRSNGTDVNEVAGTFGGGGHVLASGCKIRGEYEEVVDRLVFAIKTRIKE